MIIAQELGVAARHGAPDSLGRLLVAVHALTQGPRHLLLNNNDNNSNNTR